MKSRKARKREAYYWIAGEVGAVVILLLILAVSEGVPDRWVGVLGSVLTVAGTLGGVALGYRLSHRQKQEDDQRRRQALATLLLSEIRFLEGALRQLCCSDEPREEAIEPFQTAMYDQAGANLLLFSSATVHALNAFYQLIHDLRAVLIQFRTLPPEANTPLPFLDRPLDYDLRLKATYAACAIDDVATRLRDEGGVWPQPLPLIVGHPPELPDMPPPVFGRSDSRRSGGGNRNLPQWHEEEP